jgi:hypothetical protein
VVVRLLERSTTKIDSKKQFISSQSIHRIPGERVQETTAEERFRPRILKTFDPVALQHIQDSTCNKSITANTNNNHRREPRPWQAEHWSPGKAWSFTLAREPLESTTRRLHCCLRWKTRIKSLQPKTRSRQEQLNEFFRCRPNHKEKVISRSRVLQTLTVSWNFRARGGD